MKLSLFFAFSYLATATWAGGYQGCLERVLLFQAYEIDGLNDEKDRSIGYKCTKWNDTLKRCDGTWAACKPKRKGADRCNYDELLVHLGKTHVQKGWSVVDEKGNLEVEKTEVNTYKMYEARPRPPTAALIPNFPPHVAMNPEVSDWNEFIAQLNEKVNNTWKTKMTADNKHLWTNFDDTNETIRTARAGDHGPYLYKEAKKQLGDKMEIHKQNLGKNPVTNVDCETVDWNATVDAAVKKGMTRADADEKGKGFLNKFYRGDNDEFAAARKHHAVIESYKRMASATAKCRR